jgi:DNA-binding HxlR family transcriptional regulator
MVEEVLKCKWAMTVLDLARQGVRRPGAMVMTVDGLTKKVLNERLKKLVRFGILDRVAYPEIPPRVEYGLTPFGKKFIGILEAIENLDEDRARR